jgi:pimeloyl-ACP methyl ester carboxylesterase
MAVSELSVAPICADNSTNDHAIILPIPRFVRLPFQLASRISPRLGGELGRLIFFHPRKAFYTDLQRQLLDRAERHDFAPEGGKKVAAYSWGDGPAVLLVHGWGGHSGQMTPFAEPLLKAGFRVIAIDMPAHGQSEGKLSSLVHFSAALLEAGRRFGPIAGVVTHSLGGAGLVRAFLDGLAARRAVLISPQAQFNDYWRLFRDSLGMTDKSWAAMVETSERWLGIPFAKVHAMVGAPSMTVPALIIHGVKDRVSPVREGRKLAHLWPGAELIELDTGHQSILREPSAINAATAFLTK